MVVLHGGYEVPQARHSLVLIHAFPLNASMYDDVVPLLAKAGISVYCVDLPGFGDAPRLQGWTIREAARSINNELRSRGVGRSVIAGTSMGGYTALAYMREFPDEVDALILSNTKAEADTPEAKEQRMVFARDVLERGYDAVYMRMLPKLIAKPLAERRPELLDRLRSMISQARPESIADALYALAEREDSTDLLKDITVPTLVIAGGLDELIPSAVTETMSKMMMNARYRELPESGHLSPFEMPVEWSQAVSQLIETISRSS